MGYGMISRYIGETGLIPTKGFSYPKVTAERR
jgi:hypothetical protein